MALGIRLRAGAVFESFAPGFNGELLAVLRSQSALPLWIWGARATGKTHLLQAAAAAVNRNSAYFPLDRRVGLPPEALLGFAGLQILCVDDVDAVVGDLQWETALFRLFNEAAELGTRLIFAARAAPQALHWCLEDWQSRAAACVVYQLRDLDDCGRSEALRLRAAQRGLEMPPETLDYLMRRMPRDLPTLLGILDQLDEASLVAQRRLTIPFIRDALDRHAKFKTPLSTGP